MEKIQTPLENKETVFFLPPKAGEMVEGIIIGNDRYSVYIDLGAIGIGIIFGKEYYAAKNILKGLNPGDGIKAKVIEIDNRDGYIELSLREAKEEGSWERLKNIERTGEVIKIKINGANKGGLLAELQEIKGFLPLSQLSIEHYPRVKDGDATEILKSLQQLVGEELEVKIIDATKEENKLIFSEKAVTSKEIGELLTQYSPGDTVEGKITGIADFGAFIKFPMIEEGKEDDTLQTEGLIHISELDWQLIDSVTDIVKVADVVKVKIIDISKEGKVSLSLKALKEDPWKEIDKKFKKGDQTKGSVVKINQLGAFVEVAPKIRGLLHTSQNQANGPVVVKDKEYNFEIISLDPTNHKMGLRLIS
ncbi:S1 RNA-binding domain-containing protein [Patescibacteria group bacterium]|nr:S1 RNA-binding domain-containing protein [Patescibacteria group bacterium]MBU4023339.1 S1 RNA-binding domain-containing protein [Patescibacteria group bacterium]